MQQRMNTAEKQLRILIREEILRVVERADPDLKRILGSTQQLSGTDSKKFLDSISRVKRLVSDGTLLKLSQEVSAMKSKRVDPEAFVKFLNSKFGGGLASDIEAALGMLSAKQYDSLAYNLTSQDDDVMTGEQFTELSADPLETVQVLKTQKSFINSMSLYALADQLKSLHSVLTSLISSVPSGEDESAIDVSLQGIRAAMNQPEKKSKGFFSFLGRD